MKKNDIFLIAKAIEDTLLEISRNNNGANERKKIHIVIDADENEFSSINKDFYLEANGTMEGYQDSEEILIEILGFDFQVKRLETKK